MHGQQQPRLLLAPLFGVNPCTWTREQFLLDIKVQNLVTTAHQEGKVSRAEVGARARQLAQNDYEAVFDRSADLTPQKSQGLDVLRSVPSRDGAAGNAGEAGSSSLLYPGGDLIKEGAKSRRFVDDEDQHRYNLSNGISAGLTVNSPTTKSKTRESPPSSIEPNPTPNLHAGRTYESHLYIIRKVVKENNEAMILGKKAQTHSGKLIKRGTGDPVIERLIDLTDLQVELCVSLERLNDPATSTSTKSLLEHFSKIKRWSRTTDDQYGSLLRNQVQVVSNAIDRKASAPLPTFTASPLFRQLQMPQSARSTPSSRPSTRIQDSTLLDLPTSTQSSPIPTGRYASPVDADTTRVELLLEIAGGAVDAPRRMWWHPEHTRDQFFDTVSKRFSDRTVQSVAVHAGRQHYFVEPTGSDEEWMIMRDALQSNDRKTAKVRVRLG